MRTLRCDDGKFEVRGECGQFGFFDVGKRPDNRKVASKELLAWLHGTDLSFEEKVEKNCLDDVVHVVGKGKTLRVDFAGQIKEGFSPVPTAPEAAELFFFTFPLVRGAGDNIRNSFRLEILDETIGVEPGKSHVDKAGDKFEADGDELGPFLENAKKAKTVFASGDGDNDLVTVLEHLVVPNGFSDLLRGAVERAVKVHKRLSARRLVDSLYVSATLPVPVQESAATWPRLTSLRRAKVLLKMSRVGRQVSE